MCCFTEKKGTNPIAYEDPSYVVEDGADREIERRVVELAAQSNESII